jgi:putative ABC transport system permease protein
MHLREAVENLLQDLRYAARGLRARPAFTLAVVVTLGLGIGANAAMFSVIDRLLFRPPPMLKDPALTHRVYLGTTNRGRETLTANLAIGRSLDLARTTSSFSRFAQFTRRDLAVGQGSDSREMSVGVVTASFFDFFDAPPALGRNFTGAEDSTPSGTPVVVISYSYWQTQFGGRRDALGASMRIGPLVYTIIGVEPAGFAGVWPDQPPVAYIPLSSYASTLDSEAAGPRWWTNHRSVWSTTMAMRRPGVSVATASADLTNQFRAIYAAELLEAPHDTPMELAKPRALAASIIAERGPRTTQLTKVATWISGVALVVLLIACANVANLLLARALNRRREIAVRLALGVSRGRLLSMLFTESLLLGLCGGAAGIAVAQAGSGFLRAAFLAKSAPMNVVADPRTMLFAAAGALVVGLVTGLAPAFQLGKVSLTDDLKMGAREGRYQRSPLRLGLIIVQGALSVVLLVGAGLFVRSLSNVRQTRLGYDVDPVLVLSLNTRDVTLDPAQTQILKEKLLANAKALPEVQNASRQISAPFRGSMIASLYIAGIDTVSKLGDFALNAVSPGYFATLGTRIIRGRGITDADRAGAPGAMVVSQRMATRLWPNADAIGQCVKVEADTAPCTYVVGIAEDIKSQRLDDSPDDYYYYLAIAQFHPDFGGLFIRTRANNGADVAESIRRRLQPDMPGGSYLTVTPFSEVIGRQTASWSLGASMFLALGILALVLAAIGLFSVISYNVAQRRHELGVRMALGAQQVDLVGLVVREGMRLGLIGVGLGGVAAYTSGRWIAPLLFKASPHDPVVFGVVVSVLLIVAFVASLIPARRAASVDPIQALRSE